MHFFAFIYVCSSASTCSFPFVVDIYLNNANSFLSKYAPKDKIPCAQQRRFAPSRFVMCLLSQLQRKRMHNPPNDSIFRLETTEIRTKCLWDAGIIYILIGDSPINVKWGREFRRRLAIVSLTTYIYRRSFDPPSSLLRTHPHRQTSIHPCRASFHISILLRDSRRATVGPPIHVADRRGVPLRTHRRWQTRSCLAFL